MTTLDSTEFIRPVDGLTSPVTFTCDENGRIGLSLSMSPEAFQSLFQVARATGSTLDEVIGKAFVLYRLAAKAHAEGKHTAILDADWEVEREVVGFKGSKDGHAVESR